MHLYDELRWENETEERLRHSCESTAINDSKVQDDFIYFTDKLCSTLAVWNFFSYVMCTAAYMLRYQRSIRRVWWRWQLKDHLWRTSSKNRVAEHRYHTSNSLSYRLSGWQETHAHAMNKSAEPDQYADVDVDVKIVLPFYKLFIGALSNIDRLPCSGSHGYLMYY